IVSGPSGIGKSRLLAELMVQAERRGMFASIGRGSPIEMSLPYALAAAGMSPVFSGVNANALTVRARGIIPEVRALFPSLTDASAAAPPPRLTDHDERARAFWHATQLIQRVAERQPLLIALDNAQWSDTSSAELIHFVAKQLPTMRVLLVIAT